MVSELKFDRTPYTVRYQKDGVQHKIRRVPPPKLHDMLPGDEVTISRKKGDSWDKGTEVKIKHINTRHPNTLQIEDGDGKTTFLDYMDLNFKGREEDDIDSKDRKSIAKDPIGSQYLLWP